MLRDRRPWVLAALAVVASWCLVPSAALAAGVERITTYNIDYDIRADGVVDVTERIAYDFGSTSRHGIIRDIPTREPADADHDRVYTVKDVEVASPSGAPSEVDVQDTGRSTYLRIGDPDRTVTGQQTYEIRYRLEGALNTQSDLDELYWDAVGAEWDVPVEQATVTVQAPDGIEKIACYSDPTGGSTSCDKAVHDTPQAARFFQESLDVGQALTVVVGIRSDIVDVPAPVLVGRDDPPEGPRFPGLGGTLDRPGPVPYAVAAFVILGSVSVAGVGYWRRGRDQRYLGVPLGMLPHSGVPAVSAPASRRRPAVAPEFRPPDGMRPGVAGTLLDERADTLDVSATIVDLAVRRYLHIEEIPPKYFWNNRDWRLTRLQPPPGDQLSAAELALLGALFRAGGSQVQVSELKNRFAEDLKKIKEQFYAEVVGSGWFHKRPDKSRRAWELAGGLVSVAGVVAAGYSLSNGLFGGMVVGAGGAAAGLVLRMSARAMPARTPAGSAMLARVQGFRRYLETAEAEQLRWEEGEDIFNRYLPYAMVFGVTERWARVFATLAAAQAASAGVYWYSGPRGFDVSHLGVSLSNFADSTGSMLSSGSSSSGGSGFSGGSSGGGGGGGGGGSW